MRAQFSCDSTLFSGGSAPECFSGRTDSDSSSCQSPAASLIGCVLMASGRSARFGRDKLTADFLGAPMICRILSATDSPLFARRIAVTRSPEIAAFCREHDTDVLLHDLPHRSDTVRLGLSALIQSQTFRNATLAGCMFCPCDQPLLRRETLEDLCRSFLKKPDAIWRLGTPEHPGSPILFPRSFFPELLRLPEKKGGSFLAKKYPEQVCYLPVRNLHELEDADTQDALERLARLASLI